MDWMDLVRLNRVRMSPDHHRLYHRGLRCAGAENQKYVKMMEKSENILRQFGQLQGRLRGKGEEDNKP